MYFDPDGTRRDNSVRIEQYRINETTPTMQRVLVAYLVNNGTQLRYVESESNETVWPGMPTSVD